MMECKTSRLALGCVALASAPKVAMNLLQVNVIKHLHTDGGGMDGSYVTLVCALSLSLSSLSPEKDLRLDYVHQISSFMTIH